MAGKGFMPEPYIAAIGQVEPVRHRGRVTRVVGTLIESQGPPARVGDRCLVGKQGISAEVIGFRDRRLLLTPLGGMQGVAPGDAVEATPQCLSVKVGPELLGRVLDGLGHPLDELGALPADCAQQPLESPPPHPLKRQRISQPLPLGVRAVDAFLTCGRGQRLGIFSGSGVGKSTLLGMMAKNARADVSVIALIGERGREVRDFLDKVLGPDGLQRSVVIVATSEQTPLYRVKAAYAATAIAEYFRNEGQDVLLLMDSLTRFAMAQRELGLAAGEPPTTRGYTPSVFMRLAQLLERSGTDEHGSISGLYTVLVEGDDMNDPIADAVRGILDGHVVLSRRLAQINQYPAIDVLDSISRLMVDVADEKHQEVAAQARSIMATYRENEDLINIGAYVPGSSKAIDEAVELYPRLMECLRQGLEENSTLEETVSFLETALARKGAGGA